MILKQIYIFKNEKRIDWDATNNTLVKIIKEENPTASISENAMTAEKTMRLLRKIAKKYTVKKLYIALKKEND